MQYQPSFVANRAILSDTDKKTLAELAKRYTLAQFRQDARNYDEMAVDFVYTSAKIEGNTYDRLDTDNLLRLGITAGGKRYSDAVMLINLRNAFERVMQTDPHTSLNLDYFGDMHKILMTDLLPMHEQGIVRTSPVNITATNYRPPADPQQLRTEAKIILEQASQYADIFEQAIYLHCNLAYLQYFRDGNKRTARLMQTAALVRGDLMPLFFNDSLIDRYQRATVYYYETGNYAPYVDFFTENYRLTIEELTGERYIGQAHNPSVRQRIDALPKLQQGSPAEKLLWQFAEDAIARASSPSLVNWPDVERRTLSEGIIKGFLSADLVNVLCQHSPGAATAEKQAALHDDARRLTAAFGRQVRNMTKDKDIER